MQGHWNWDIWGWSLRIKILTSESSDGGDQLHQDGFHWRHSGLDQDGVIADLMRDLVQQDGQGGNFADTLTGDEGSSDGQSVGKVVEEIGEQV